MWSEFRYLHLNCPENEVVSGFSDGNIASVLESIPELVITFSDVQAALAETVIRAGSQSSL